MERSAIARAFSGPDELVFTDHTFVAVSLALDPVLKDAGLFGQQANDLEASAAGRLLVPVRRKADSLSDRELMCGHRVLRGRAVGWETSKPPAACRCRRALPSARIRARPRATVPSPRRS